MLCLGDDDADQADARCWYRSQQPKGDKDTDSREGCESSQLYLINCSSSLSLCNAHCPKHMLTDSVRNVVRHLHPPTSLSRPSTPHTAERALAIDSAPDHLL